MSEEFLTTNEFGERLAGRLGRRKPYHRTAVKSWIDSGLLPGAKLIQTPRGPFWQIPVSLVETFKPPVVGRQLGWRKAKPEAVSA